MIFLHSEIGSAKDNLKSPIHNWYKFIAGFSYKFVEEVIKFEKLDNKSNSSIFDPFAGCGTTLVSSQKAGVNAVGNESQSFMFDIIQAKLNWDIDISNFNANSEIINNFIIKNERSYNVLDEAHPLLLSLYNQDDLKTLYLIRNSLEFITDNKYYLFFKLALSQTLHKTSIHPIAAPYIVRNKIKTNELSAWKIFNSLCNQMLTDIINTHSNKTTSKIYLHDSRTINKKIKENSCDICITSPPYLNNLDYGEVSKVHTHFFQTTNSWNDITKNIRKKLVTGSTTHYAKSEFNLDDFISSEFIRTNKNISQNLINLSNQIKLTANTRKGKKSFDILMLLYFQDMFYVLKEIKRAIKPHGKSYLILGDSAPYGVYIPTTELLGEIGLNCGFQSYKIHTLRSRGKKWKNLTYRHNVELTENVLILE